MLTLLMITYRSLAKHLTSLWVGLQRLIANKFAEVMEKRHCHHEHGVASKHGPFEATLQFSYLSLRLKYALRLTLLLNTPQVH